MRLACCLAGITAGIKGHERIHKEGRRMARNRLRIYYGPDEPALAIAAGTMPAESEPRHSVTVPLDEVLPGMKC
jgi:hypothetical protein